MRADPRSSNGATRLAAWCTAGLAVALLLIIAGLKWATFARFGSAMPDWDQWDAEALKLLVPWFEGDHFLARLFEPHNEHRVVITKLQNLLLTLFNGQWDSRLFAVANALIHAALGVAFWWQARRWFRAAWAQATVYLFAVILFGLPLAWQNVLGGFHSQQYWLAALSFAALVTLPFNRPGSAAWWGGVIAALFACLTMGSGFLAAVVAALVVGWRALRRDLSWGEAAPTLALGAVLLAIGFAIRVEVYYHAQLKAQTLHDFTFSLLRSLEWPLTGRDWAGLVLWTPWALLAGRALFGRGEKSGPAALAITALGGWVLVQLLATAYARGAGADYPASRYMDTLTFGAMVNVAALARLATEDGAARVSRFGLALLAAAWLALFTLGLRALLERNLAHELPDTRKYYDLAEQHMRGYLTTDDPQQLAFPDIPYPSAGGLIERLRHRCLRDVMPAEIHAALPLTAAEHATTAFRTGQISALQLDQAPRSGTSPATPALPSHRTWGSFGQEGAATTGTWRSAPLTATGKGWLKFEVAGQPEADGIRLELRDAATDRGLSRISPTRSPGDSWRAAYVPTPTVPFVVVAQDQSPTAWIAVSAPVEMGQLSYLAWRLTQHGMLIACGAAAAAVLLGGLMLVGNRRK
jgi:hypothetical protein